MHLTHRRRGTLEKVKEGVIATAKDAIADTAEAGLDAAAAGIEATKEMAVTAGTAVTEAVSSLATKAAKGDPRKARQEDKTQAVGKEADRPEGFCHGPKDARQRRPAQRSRQRDRRARRPRSANPRRQSGRRRSANPKLLRDVHPNGRSARTLAYPVLSRTWFLSCLLTRTDPTAGM